MYNFYLYVLFLTFLPLLTAKEAPTNRKPKPNIAVIGAGIGGTAATYFLQEAFTNQVDIDLYEANEIGGRLATVEIGKKSYDSGGTMIHARNHYMINFTNILGITRNELSSERLALYDGTEVIFDGSSWSWVMGAQLFWRYGMDLVRLTGFVADMIKKFERIYEHQSMGLAFTTPEKLLESMSPEFLECLRSPTTETLSGAGIGTKLIDELVMAAQRSNYGQTTATQSFVGAVSIGGIEPGLWRAEGGNKRIPEKLANRSKIKLIKEKVNSIILNEATGRKYDVVTSKNSKTYDFVIVATPLHDNISTISFENFPKIISDFPQHFHRTVATFVRGQPNFPKFKYSTLHDFPEVMLTVKDTVFFNSIGKQTALYARESYKTKQELPVWKVFSQEPLSDPQIDQLFLSYEEKKVVDWMAYPHYKSKETDLPPFVLDDRLYYINGIELCASAMEMSAIGARNVALLAFNNWNNRWDLTDPDFHEDENVGTDQQQKKGEL